jgi:DNA-binding SARP family transcriptional activator
MEFRILGPVEVVDGGRVVSLGPSKQRALLAVLLLHVNEVVSRDRLIEDLWGERAPQSAAASLHTYVSQLRKLLEPDSRAPTVLLTRAPGYVLELDTERVDLNRFELLARRGKSELVAGNAGAAATTLAEALSLWRGEPLQEFGSAPFALAESLRLQELRVSALENRIDADLALGRNDALVAQLETLVTTHPYRERLRAQLMLALYRSGRQVQALEAYRKTRRHLAEELGLEPGEALRRLQKAILGQDPLLDLAEPTEEEVQPAASARAPAETPEWREVRKTVTVLFCDLTGSTALGELTDPEVLRALLARYFERMKGIVELHGGSVEKFIGDAVMAVFGVPVAHEDDALRACRAAMEMRDALPDLGVEGRVGVNTGEVVAGTGERLATGDAVNVAAGLEQAAQPGEVLLGAETMRLVEGAVEAEPVEPLELKGKHEPVPALRLVRVGEAPERRHGDLFVGREWELDAIAAAWARAAAEQRSELVTVVADPGVGKTRLAVEALGRLGVRAVRGRCLSYGEGITYWPVVEVVQQLAARPADPAAAAAIASLLGETPAATSADEIAWAFRKMLEEQAPLVCLFEDIHWGEETFLDLVEHVALLTTGAQVLLLCTARPELLERRHSWPVTLRLAPLEPADVDRLVPAGLPAALRDQIARAAGGNPLFVTEMVAMAASGDGEVSVPPNLRALLTARLDQIDPAERRVLERGAVEGEIFHRCAVRRLTPEEPQVTARLAALVRRELLRPDRAQIPGEDGFRFRHLLIRDAAYKALPKSVRAELHERFAEWLIEKDRELVKLDEILGYHLEQAHHYRYELGQDDEHTRRLGDKASDCLARAGYAAWSRNDEPAAGKLLGRSVDLATSHDRRVELELDLTEAERHVVGPAAAAGRATALAERSHAAGDDRGELLAQMSRLCAEHHLDPQNTLDRLSALSQQAVETFEQSHDDAGLLRALRAQVFAAHARSRAGDELVAARRALALAKKIGDERTERSARGAILACQLLGPTPVNEALRSLDEHLRGSHVRLGDGALKAILLAMLGRFDEARALDGEACQQVAERGSALYLAALRAWSSPAIEALAGDYEAAERFAREGCLTLEAHGEKAWLSSAAPLLGQFLLVLGRDADAEEWTEKGRRMAAQNDQHSQMIWRQVKAKILSRRGEHEKAERLAQEALAQSAETEMLDATAAVYADLGEVLDLAGKRQDAATALQTAIALYTRKGNVIMADRTRTRFALLTDPS